MGDVASTLQNGMRDLKLLNDIKEELDRTKKREKEQREENEKKTRELDGFKAKAEEKRKLDDTNRAQEQEEKKRIQANKN